MGIEVACSSPNRESQGCIERLIDLTGLQCRAYSFIQSSSSSTPGPGFAQSLDIAPSNHGGTPATGLLQIFLLLHPTLTHLNRIESWLVHPYPVGSQVCPAARQRTVDGSAVEDRTTAGSVYGVHSANNGLRAVPTAVAWAASSRATSSRRVSTHDAQPRPSRVIHHVAFESIVTITPAAPTSRVADPGLAEPYIPDATSRIVIPFRPPRSQLFSAVQHGSLEHASTVWDVPVSGGCDGHGRRFRAVKLFLFATNIRGRGPRSGIATDGGNRDQE